MSVLPFLKVMNHLQGDVKDMPGMPCDMDAFLNQEWLNYMFGFPIP